MTRCVALLRGVNVGGVTIKPADLAELFRALGADNVRTVLASGNVVFDMDGPDDAAQAALKARIEQALGERFGYDAWIVLETLDRVRQVIDGFPFDAARDGWHPYVMFSSSPSSLAELLEAAPGLDPADESVVAGDGVLYWHCRRAVGSDSPFSKLAAKARFRSSTTNRNLRTLQKLA
ncbi:pyridoxamine 5-phosphate oxidase [Microterricola viridarii]|uniref:Pyridoxamine 5-phosphate oxidase n=2 Tax=Microterricola viridarii TaxID=412690 RepID=A0A0Y0Q9Z6_9MICO|nr:pyridoxamine 5-phosphate oxidase [Microterricola viridarii]